MHIRKLLVLIILGLTSLSATADFRTTMEVWEIDLVNLRLPGTESGTLTFSDCEECESLTVRVTPATRYTVNKRDVSLADFRKVIAGIVDRQNTIIDVSHDLIADRIVQLNVKL